MTTACVEIPAGVDRVVLTLDSGEAAQASGRFRGTVQPSLFVGYLLYAPQKANAALAHQVAQLQAGYDEMQVGF